MSIDIEIKTLENFFGRSVRVYRDNEGRIIVDGDIVISPDEKLFNYMPFQIYKLNGDLEWHGDGCKQSNLTSLKNFPIIVNGNVCVFSSPNLTSLEGAPREITGNFEFDKCNVTSFDGICESIGKNLIASYNPIKDVTALKDVKVEGIISLIDINPKLITEAKETANSSIIIKYVNEENRVII